MLKCCECESDIDIKNIIYRCFDATVCSKKCQIERCLKIQKKDVKMNNFNLWDKTTSYLINPKETIKEMQKIPSFIPVYVKSSSHLKKTISKYNLDSVTNEKSNSHEYYKNNILLDNRENKCKPLNTLYSGVNKLYNIINNMI
jgi:hypothetical protein